MVGLHYTLLRFMEDSDVFNYFCVGVVAQMMLKTLAALQVRRFNGYMQAEHNVYRLHIQLHRPIHLKIMSSHSCIKQIVFGRNVHLRYPSYLCIFIRIFVYYWLSFLVISFNLVIFCFNNATIHMFYYSWNNTNINYVTWCEHWTPCLQDMR